MEITKKYLEDELGLKKECTENGVEFYEFAQGQYFYVSLTAYGTYYFVDESLSSYESGTWSNGIINNRDVFQKLYL